VTPGGSLRIAYVYDAVYPWVTGGVEKRVWEFARRLATDHDVHWFGLHHWEGPRRIEREGVTLHGVGPARDLYAGDRRSITAALGFAARLVGPLLGERFDVVDCQEFPYFPAFAAKTGSLAGDETVLLTWHEVWDDYWYDYLGRAGIGGKTVERVVARLPDAHLAVSERTAGDVRGLGVAECPVVPNGVDRGAIDAVSPADRDVDVLRLGRLIPEKGVDLLLDAMAHLDGDRSCLVVGEGPERDRLERRARTRDLPVTFEGFVDDHDDVLGLLKAADVLAHPSRREGFGMTVLESLACGTPVATTDHPRNAASELVDRGRTGWVSPPTAEGLAEGLREAPRCDGTACREATTGYDWDVLVDDLEAAYRMAANGEAMAR